MSAFPPLSFHIWLRICYRSVRSVLRDAWWPASTVVGFLEDSWRILCQVWYHTWYITHLGTLLTYLNNIDPSIRPSFHPSIHPSVRPSVRPSVHPSIHPHDGHSLTTPSINLQQQQQQQQPLGSLEILPGFLAFLAFSFCFIFTVFIYLFLSIYFF